MNHGLFPSFLVSGAADPRTVVVQLSAFYCSTAEQSVAQWSLGFQVLEACMIRSRGLREEFEVFCQRFFLCLPEGFRTMH